MEAWEFHIDFGKRCLSNVVNILVTHNFGKGSVWMVSQVVGDCNAIWKLEVSTLVEFGDSNRLSCDGGMISSRDLEITNFVDVFVDENDLRWGRM
jgi:hypothetical protein